MMLLTFTYIAIHLVQRNCNIAASKLSTRHLPVNEICQIPDVKLFAYHICHPSNAKRGKCTFFAKLSNIRRYEREMSIYCLINCGGLMTALGLGERYVGRTVYHSEFMPVILKAQDSYPVQCVVLQGE